MDDFPELLRPIKIVIGLNRIVTGQSKMRKLDNVSSFNIVLVLDAVGFRLLLSIGGCRKSDVWNADCRHDTGWALVCGRLRT